MAELNKRSKILLLTIVHPDFLPPVYAIAQTLADHAYDVHILTFDSFVPSEVKLNDNIVLECLGKHHNVSFFERRKLRQKLLFRARNISSESPTAIIAFCQYSYMIALKIKKTIPVIYHALEMADYTLKNFKRSPLNTIANYNALRQVKNADIVSSPSFQRSAWMAGRCHLDFTPFTILNTAYLSNVINVETIDIFKSGILPANFQNKKIVLYTGAVNNRLCIKELVRAFDLLNDSLSVLVITGFKDNTYCNEIRDIVSNCQSKDKIKLLSYVTRDEMLALQKSAHIGVCLSKEIEHDLESQMIAPNKVGEYLEKGLLLLGAKSVYMQPFEMKGVAVLAVTCSVEDISSALKKSLEVINTKDYKSNINNFVKEYFCMQQQLMPVINFLKK